MAGAREFWDRLRGEARTLSGRTREGANRALRGGVLRVDLLSLRRDRTRAHAHIGERVLALWAAGGLESVGCDPEVLRLKELVQTIEESIAAKEAEVAALRSAAPESAANI